MVTFNSDVKKSFDSVVKTNIEITSPNGMYFAHLYNVNRRSVLSASGIQVVPIYFFNFLFSCKLWQAKVIKALGSLTSCPLKNRTN